MDKKLKNGIIVTLFIAAIGFFAYKTFAKPKPSNITPPKSDGGTTNQENFDKVVANLNVAKNGTDYISYYFNSGKNLFVFYNNNRMYIADKNGNIISMGTYSDGGKSISLDNGKSANGGSVWTNVLNLLK